MRRSTHPIDGEKMAWPLGRKTSMGSRWPAADAQRSLSKMEEVESNNEIESRNKTSIQYRQYRCIILHVCDCNQVYTCLFLLRT